MPIGFVSPPKSVTPIHVSPDEKKLINYLMKSELSSVTNSDDFSAFLEVQIAFKRGAPSDLTSISVIRDDRDPEAIKVTLSEVDLKLRYPWDYAELTKRLRSRYIDFKASQKYHNIREALKTDGRFAWTRELNPGNPKSGKKDFFSPDIYMEFDKHYTRGP